MTGRWPLADTTLRQRMAQATADPVVPGRIGRAVDRFGDHRSVGLGELADPDGLRRSARALKASILAELPEVLDRLEAAASARGVVVHRAVDAADARRVVVGLVAGRRVVKAKSMATEEIGLNEALESSGAPVVETDLGEWIIQLAGEPPSHIIAPAVHHDRHSIGDVFEKRAGARGVAAEPTALNSFARRTLRAEFLAAEVGITGVNFAVADTGSLVLVTNEGNGRLVTSLPKVHIAVLGMERVLRSWAELDLMLALLVRSATGQRLTSYTSAITGPRRRGEPDGPDEVHLVVLDNGRSALAGTGYDEMLACLRCGACLNVCPVYRQSGGHAYGWVYPGPMGAVLTPLLHGEDPHAAELPGASTLCGACMDACPVEIPLQDLLVSLRRERANDAARAERAAWRAWAQAWSRPSTYRASTGVAALSGRLGDGIGRLPGAARWAQGRAVPVPARHTFGSLRRRRWGDEVVAARPGAVAVAPAPRPRPRHGIDLDGCTDAGAGALGGPQRFAPHPRPAPSTEVATLAYSNVVAKDLPGTFVAAVEAAGGRVCTAVEPGVPDDVLTEILDRHSVRRVVVDSSAEAQAAGARLADLRPDLSVAGLGSQASRAERESADLGITSAVALVAATGSLALDCSVAGDRTTSLLPRVHLAVVPADRLVATPGDVWARLGGPGVVPPSNLVLVTGPSRTGDIEQLLTVGVHGPEALEVVLTSAPR